MLSEPLRITLVRHGRPGFDLAGMARARDLPAIVRSYDDAGIVDSPPPEARALAAMHEKVWCSDLHRAVASAKALGVDASQINADALFREGTLPHFDRGGMLLPVSVWVVLLRILCFSGFELNGESFRALQERALVASRQLEASAQEYRRVMLVGHGFLNRYIARHLVDAGWQGPRNLRQGYWGHASYFYAPG